MITFLIVTSPLTIYIGIKLLDRYVADYSGRAENDGHDAENNQGVS